MSKAHSKPPVESAVTEDLIRSKAEDLLLAVNQLADAEDPENNQAAIIPVYAAASELAGLFCDGAPVPGSMRHVLPALVVFSDAALDVELVASVECGRPRRERWFAAPGRAFSAAIHELATGLAKPTPPALRPLESIAMLDKQLVNHQQIARIYGFLDAEGQPEAWRIEEELKEPGKHINSATWVDPRAKGQQANAIEVAKQNVVLERNARRIVSLGCNWDSMLPATATASSSV
jgi:hypothetical protein